MPICESLMGLLTLDCMRPCGAVWLAQRTFNPLVLGSNPSGGTLTRQNFDTTRPAPVGLLTPNKQPKP